MGTAQERTREPASEVRVHVDDPRAAATIAAALRSLALQAAAADGLLVLCVGTDRSIGDALGPLVGTFLQESGPHPFSILGTLDRPVHAGNLADTLAALADACRHPVILAIDACLGRAESVGNITVAPGPLRPGAGVNKTLPGVGDLHITGVVNVGGFMEYFVLQNTRLSLVMRMARCIAEGVLAGLRAAGYRAAAAVATPPDAASSPSTIGSCEA